MTKAREEMRKIWSTPKLQSISAGSAEADINAGAADAGGSGPNDYS